MSVCVNLPTIADSFIFLDKVCDCIPVISTISNMVVIFEKTIVIPFLERCFPESLDNRYITYVNKKNEYLCIALLFPLVFPQLKAIHVHFGNYKVVSKQLNDLIDEVQKEVNDLVDIKTSHLELLQALREAKSKFEEFASEERVIGDDKQALFKGANTKLYEAVKKLSVSLKKEELFSGATNPKPSPEITQSEKTPKEELSEIISSIKETFITIENDLVSGNEALLEGKFTLEGFIRQLQVFNLFNNIVCVPDACRYPQVLSKFFT